MENPPAVPTVNNNDFFINGFKVTYPTGRKPFPAQLAVISKVLQAAKERKNALLESPTGTGKTLALLVSTLAFQKAVRHGEISLPPLKNEPPPETGNIKVKAEPINQPVKTEPASKVKWEATKHFKSEPNVQVKAEPNGKENPGPGDGTQEPKKKRKLKVIYCTRTHSQLKQVVEELKNCPEEYKEQLVMCSLGAREHLCVNPRAKNIVKTEKKSINEVCKELMDDFENGCAFGLNKKRMRDTIFQTKNLKVWDIEDAHRMGVMHRGCPYFASRAIFEEANYSFAPYNYIIDPDIRRSMGVALSDSIVIFDEAHNIEDACREAASLETSVSQLKEMEHEIEKVKNLVGFNIIADIGKLISNLLDWIQTMTSTMTTLQSKQQKVSTPGMQRNRSRNDDSYLNEADNIWLGPEFIEMFESKYGLNEDSLQMYQKLLGEIMLQMKENEALVGRFGEENQPSAVPLAYEDYPGKPNNASDEEDNEDGSTKNLSSNGKRPDFKLAGRALSFLEKFLRIISYFFRNNRQLANEFRIVIQEPEKQFDGKAKKRKANEIRGNNEKNEDYLFNIWCMTGSVIFQEISDQAHCVILTSGTLSPLDSFAGELNTAFPIRLEANHVINLAKQLKVGLISSVKDFSLNSTYIAQQSDDYLDHIGISLLMIAKVTPGGTLMFLPSYALLNRLMNRWGFTRLLQRIQVETGANIYFEPKDVKEMKNVLRSYYNDLSSINSKAIMIGVCRGKVSEGINFSDHYARSVIMVGIPYPSLVCPKVQVKKQYQDLKSSSDVEKSHSNGIYGVSSFGSNSFTATPMKVKDENNLNTSYQTSSITTPATTSKPDTPPTMHVTGAQWYKQQAFRAINQAIGRCIRHKDDFGSIIFLDPRFQQENITQHLSKWMRNETVSYEKLEDMVVQMKFFFQGLHSYERLEKGLVPPVKLEEEDDDALLLKALNVKKEKKKEIKKEKEMNQSERTNKRKKEEVIMPEVISSTANKLSNNPFERFLMKTPSMSSNPVPPIPSVVENENKINREEDESPMEIEEEESLAGEFPVEEEEKEETESTTNPPTSELSRPPSFDEISISQAFQRAVLERPKLNIPEIQQFLSQSTDLKDSKGQQDGDDYPFQLPSSVAMRRIPSIIQQNSEDQSTFYATDSFNSSTSSANNTTTPFQIRSTDFHSSFPMQDDDFYASPPPLDDLIMPLSQVGALDRSVLINEKKTPAKNDTISQASKVFDIPAPRPINNEKEEEDEEEMSDFLQSSLTKYFLFSGSTCVGLNSSNLFLLPSDSFGFLSTAFRDGIEIAEWNSFGRTFYQVIPPLPAFTSMSSRGCSVVPLEDIASNYEDNNHDGGADERTFPSLQENQRERLLTIDHWHAADGFVYRLECYRREPSSHVYQIVTAKILAVNGQEDHRGHLNRVYGNPPFFQSLLESSPYKADPLGKNSSAEKKKRNKSKSKCIGDVFSSSRLIIPPMSSRDKQRAVTAVEEMTADLTMTQF